MNNEMFVGVLRQGDFLEEKEKPWQFNMLDSKPFFSTDVLEVPRPIPNVHAGSFLRPDPYTLDNGFRPNEYMRAVEENNIIDRMLDAIAYHQYHEGVEPTVVTLSEPAFIQFLYAWQNRRLDADTAIDTMTIDFMGYRVVLSRYQELDLMVHGGGRG